MATKKTETKEVEKTGAPDDTVLEKAPDVAGGAEIQATVDAAEEKGFIGKKADPRDNTEYTVAGVTANK